jgi:23S rRNA (adenine2503-C2)-methyltransferase
VKPDLKSLLLSELEAQLAAWGEPAYRAGQVCRWLYARRATAWEQMSDLPKPLRARGAEHYALGGLELIRQQGVAGSTRKFLWRLADGALIESVLIPANPALYGEASDRHTLCVSTQVGCAYGCRFCASGLDGWKRNLGPHEIVEQVLAVERRQAGAPGGEEVAVGDRRDPEADAPAAEAAVSPDPKGRSRSVASRLVDNLVIMGMGEPLANYEALLRALTILNAPWGVGIGARKITISTSGLAPQIRRLAEEPFQFNLAVSLHGATDEVRDRIMPVNRKYPLHELVAACEYYQDRKGRMLTFEYILMAGVNDDVAQVKPLARLARRLKAKVNVIPYNRVEGLPWERPAPEVQEAFLAALEREGIAATLRREKGHDIDAACGQLRLKTERGLPIPGGVQGRAVPGSAGGVVSAPGERGSR